MIKYIIALFFPIACFGQVDYDPQPPVVLLPVDRDPQPPIPLLISNAEPIQSYTAAQTGVGNAEVYMPEGATHVTVFIPGKGEMGTNKEALYKYNSPINQVRNGARPDHGVIAIQPAAYNSSTYLAVVKFLNWMFKTYPSLKTYSGTGLSYGAASWYDYVKKASDADYRKPYSLVLMSITSEAQCGNYTQLCGTDLRFKDIRLLAMDGTNDSHFAKQKRYTQLMISAGYPAKWEDIPNTAHCCWDVQYARKEVMDWLTGPVQAEPALSINAGADTTIYWPQDSFIIRATTNAPIGADIRASVIDGLAEVEGVVVKRLYKGSVTVRVYVFYNGKQAYDDITITAVYDPEAVFRRFKLGDLNMVILNDGRIMQEF